MHKRRFGNSAYRKILISYTAIIMIPIIIFSAVSVYQSIREDQKQQYQKHALDAKRIADSIDNKLIELKNLGKTMSNEAWLIKLIQNTNIYESEFDFLSMLEIRNNLNQDINSLGVLSFGMLIFPEKDQVLSSWGTYASEDFFKHVAVIDSATKQEIEDSLQTPDYFRILHPAKVSLWGHGKSVIPVIQSLEVVNHPRAVLVLFIDSAYFSNYLQRFGGAEYKNLRISNDEAVIYFQAQGTPSSKSLDEKTYSIELASEVSKWKYEVAYIDPRWIWVHHLLGPLLVLGLLLALGICCTLLLTKLTYQPLRMLLNKLSGKLKDEAFKTIPATGSEYSYIEKSFDRLLDENQKLQQAMKDFESAARSNMLLRLLKGYFPDEQQLNRLHHFGIPYTDDMHYCTILISFHAVQEHTHLDSLWKIEMATMMIVEDMMSRTHMNYELFEVAHADYGLILSSSCPIEDEGWVGQITAELSAAIGRVCGFQPDVLHGSLEKGIVGISKSYYAAQERLQVILFSKEHKIQEPEATIQHAIHYYYPTDWEVQLINNLKIGNLDTSIQILHEIMMENEKRQLSEGSTVKLISSLMETMLRVLQELNLDTGIYVKQFDNRVAAADPSAMWSYVFEMGTLICERKQYSNTSSSLEVGSKMLQYVNENYTNVDISLKQLSERFQLSVSGVSKLFKENTGINFYDYLCRLRMEMAKELLRESNYRIDDIAHQVGYENVYSFKRAFARYEGIKPDEYMKLAN
ncbi:helix-turn-helix transcriptional regulator [Paenibacillus sp. 1001270B_150601_E10]|uniref:helix-turn-helix transcriptional regulator n=1 Tax=Paenibacillus sp. 1001270B_150601_E10 TaxID=2787079 RepID=UPI0018A02F21|nr:AraC family transcriptional regulator [Paenibacillus sp. 1001270B_150601_E10]